MFKKFKQLWKSKIIKELFIIIIEIVIYTIFESFLKYENRFITFITIDFVHEHIFFNNITIYDNI